MAKQITKTLEISDGSNERELLYTLAKLVFGADANGVVTVPDDLTAVGTGFTNTTFVDEINSKT